MRKKRKPSRKRRGLPTGEAGVRGSTPPSLPPFSARSLLSDPTLVAVAAALALAVLGFTLIGRTGDDLWFVLVLPLLAVIGMAQREAARNHRRAAAAWWRGRPGRR